MISPFDLAAARRRILVIASPERNEKTGQLELVTSHGIDADGVVIILPQQHPKSLGARLQDGEWII